MREIKFRAWDKKDGEMFKVVTGMHIAIIFENPKRFVPMQYTGLHDNTKWEQLTVKEQEKWLEDHAENEWQGKEIYENDVVSYADGIRKSVVMWDEAGFNLGERPDFEVIGNIYENPELLKEQDKLPT